jgi:hypothetical protein
MKISVVYIRGRSEDETKDNIQRFTKRKFINMNNTENEITYYFNRTVQTFFLSLSV